MRKHTIKNSSLWISVLFLFTAVNVFAQETDINNEVVSFTKRELMSGFVFDVKKEQEELLTDETRFNEEQTLLNAKFRFENRFWNLLDYKQEQFNAAFEIGPFGGFGNWEDSSYIEHTVADQNFYGIRTSANVNYSNRIYYDAKNYTLLNVNAWGRYDLYKQNSNGETTDSLGAVSDFDDAKTKDRFRYGLNAKAAWGLGRLSPMNHLMVAHYLLEKYYPGRIFSDYEIARFAQVIATVKNNRDIKTKRNVEKEMASLSDFINGKLMLELPEAMPAEWQFSEFDPRLEGQRVEFGPFFKYYNQEPDFVYGGYIQYDNSRYKNVKWNRNFSANLNYNRYKKQDWMLGEINLGWTYYAELKSQFDFGVKYVPGIEINGFEDIGPLSHNLIPYLSYFTQLNSNSRIKLDFAWRFSDGEQFVLPGPEFSLAIYRSRY
jgi:hypothetical protein